MNLRSIFTEPAMQAGPAFRYGMLIVALVLLANDVLFHLRSGPIDHYMNTVVVLMLLFNHLAFAFKWSTHVTIALRVLAVGWIAFGLPYVFFWAGVAARH
jgi:hypothetical protein